MSNGQKPLPRMLPVLTEVVDVAGLQPVQAPAPSPKATRAPSAMPLLDLEEEISRCIHRVVEQKLNQVLQEELTRAITAHAEVLERSLKRELTERIAELLAARLEKSI